MPTFTSEDLPLANAALEVIDSVLERGHPIVVAWSSGKDSSVVANLALSAAARRVAAGKPCPRLLLTHSDTGVENPEVRALADGEMHKMAAFAKSVGIQLEIKVGKPLLYSSWPVRVIGGRALPSFPNSNGDCSVEWKVKVGDRLLKSAFAELAKDKGAAQPVLLTGVRMDESARRAANIEARGERHDDLWANEEGRLRLSPILQWSTDDVWEYLGYCHAGMLTAYSDFTATMQFYRDAGGSSCAVVGDMAMAKRQSGCGARSGCWTCVKVSKDESLQQLIASDEARYGYLRGLGQLRDFIANTQYDWSRRSMMARTIDADGFITIQPDVYSPQMLEDLLRYALTLDVVERREASKLGIRPRFRIIDMEHIFAIDAQWSLYGTHKPFHALKIYLEVTTEGKLSFPPLVSAPERVPPQKLGHLFVGEQWSEDIMSGDPRRDRMLSRGIRNPVHEMFSETCGAPTKFANDGEVLTGWETSDQFEVDLEGAEDFIGMMADDYIAEHHNDQADRTIAVQTYLSLGFVLPAHASLSRWQRIAERTQWLQRKGLVGHASADKQLLKRLLNEQAAHGIIKPAKVVEAPRTPAATSPVPVNEPVQLDLLDMLALAA